MDMKGGVRGGINVQLRLASRRLLQSSRRRRCRLVRVMHIIVSLLLGMSYPQNKGGWGNGEHEKDPYYLPLHL